MYFRRNRHKHFKYKINLLKIYLNQTQGFGLTNLIIALTRVYIDQVYCLVQKNLLVLIYYYQRYQTTFHFILN